MKTVRTLAVGLMLLSVPALARTASDPGYKILHDYVLTIPKVMAYDTAYRAFNTAAKADPSLQADAEAASNEDAPTVADTINKMTRHPRIYAYFQKQGLSQLEAALIPIVLMNACAVTQYHADASKLTDMVSQGNIDFCKNNLAKLKTTILLSGH